MYRKYLDLEIPGHIMDDWKLGAKAVVRLRKELHMLVSFISHLAYYEGALTISDAAICPSVHPYVSPMLLGQKSAFQCLVS